MQGCLHTQLNWSNRWSNKQNACLQFGNAYLSVHICLPTALHDFTASKPSKQHNHTSFSTLLSDIQETRSRASTSCSDMSMTQVGICDQEATIFLQGFLQDVLLCNSCHSTGLSPSQPWAVCLWCDVLWGDLGSIRSSAEARFTM